MVLYLLLAGFAVSLAVTPLVRELAVYVGIVDRPDALRKLHLKATARIGGIAVWTSFAIVCLAAACQHWVSPETSRRFAGLLVSAFLIFLIGLADDLWNLKPSTRLAAEVVAALLFWWSVLHRMHVGPVSAAHWWGAILTVLWVVACTNAFNLIDGVDGLCAGLAAIGASAITVAALLRGDIPLALVSGPLVGALIGFLIYNFSPASIFLGDSGSLLIGFLLGSCTVLWAQRYHTYLGATGPFVALSVPLVDTGLAILRRFLRGRSIFSPDRGHIHHRLLDRGLCPRTVAVVLYGAAVLGALTAILHQELRPPYQGLIVIVLAVIELTAIRYLRFTELPAIAHFILRGVLRHLMYAHIELWTFEEQLSKARTLSDLRTAIRKAGSAFGVVSLRITIDGEVWEEQIRNSSAACWRIHVPLTGSDYMDIVYTGSKGGLDMIGCFIECVCRELQSILLAGYADSRSPNVLSRQSAQLVAKAGGPV